MKTRLLELAKWLAVPTVAFFSWAANEYVQDLIAQEVKPVKTAVEQMVDLQRENVDSNKRRECMEYKFQDLNVTLRMAECEKESKARQAYWDWEDCRQRAVEAKADPAICDPQPEKPE
jgi:hypothetical protein